MKRNRPWYLEPGLRMFVVLAALVLVGGVATAFILSQRTPAQPIPFPHNLHVGLGVQCLYCHTGASTGPVAGLPSTNKCWGCHQQFDTTGRPKLELVASYGRNGKPIEWVPVALQPDFVHFTHRPHIAKGLACESCHGDVSKMTVAEPQPRQNMGWCIDCHTRMAPEKYTLLTDCATCHY